MKWENTAAPVVVGIDGSAAAIAAALWATEVALARGVPVRLVHVVTVYEEDIDLDEDPAEVAADWPETQYGRTSLRSAAAAVHATGKPITIDTEILWGDIDAMLIKESGSATMVCVGSVGIAPLCEQILGSTAATVAQQAQCSVAVVRVDNPASTTEPGWIVTVVDDGSANEKVVAWALEEAHLRRAPLLALGVSRPKSRGIDNDDLECRVASWRHLHPHLHISSVAVPADVAGFLADHDELSVQLAVIGDADAKQVTDIVGPHQPSRHFHNRCSALVVR